MRITMVWTVILIIGVLFLGGSGIIVFREYRWLKNAIICNGRVVESEAVRDMGADTGTTYRPHVVFTDEEGHEYTFVSSTAVYPPRYHVGDILRVAYDHQTHEGRIFSFGERFGGAVLVATLGLAMAFASTVFLFGNGLFHRIYFK